MWSADPSWFNQQPQQPSFASTFLKGLINGGMGAAILPGMLGIASPAAATAAGAGAGATPLVTAAGTAPISSGVFNPAVSGLSSDTLATIGGGVAQPATSLGVPAAGTESPGFLQRLFGSPGNRALLANMMQAGGMGNVWGAVGKGATGQVAQQALPKNNPAYVQATQGATTNAAMTPSSQLPGVGTTSALAGMTPSFPDTNPLSNPTLGAATGSVMPAPFLLASSDPSIGLALSPEEQLAIFGANMKAVGLPSEMALQQAQAQDLQMKPAMMEREYQLRNLELMLKANIDAQQGATDFGYKQALQAQEYDLRSALAQYEAIGLGGAFKQVGDTGVSMAVLNMQPVYKSPDAKAQAMIQKMNPGREQWLKTWNGPDGTIPVYKRASEFAPGETPEIAATDPTTGNFMRPAIVRMRQQKAQSNAPTAAAQGVAPAPTKSPNPAYAHLTDEQVAAFRKPTAAPTPSASPTAQSTTTAAKVGPKAVARVKATPSSGRIKSKGQLGSLRDNLTQSTTQLPSLGYITKDVEITDPSDLAQLQTYISHPTSYYYLYNALRQKYGADDLIVNGTVLPKP